MEETVQPKQPPQDSRSRSGKAALALCLAAAGSAHAENSVTIYGILDNGIEFINNQPSGSHSVTRMTSGGQAGSRWGFRGNEDLGGGSSAFFVLESGLSMDSGSLQQGGRLFGRLAYVGIETPYGLVSLGRHRNAIFDVAIPFDPMVYNLYSVFGQDPQMGGRVDNAVRYTKEAGPLTVSAQYSFGYDSTIANGSEVPGNLKVGQEWGGSIQYGNGPFGAMLAYDERHGAAVATQDNTDRRTVVAATYAWERAKAFVGVRNLRSRVGGTTAIADLYWAGLTWKFTPAVSLTGAVYQNDQKGSDRDATTFALSALYNFSKRTLAYANIGYAKNRHGSTVGLAAPNSVAPGESQTGVVAGVLHRF